jgi:hypothetical protein
MQLLLHSARQKLNDRLYLRQKSGPPGRLIKQSVRRTTDEERF